MKLSQRGMISFALLKEIYYDSELINIDDVKNDYRKYKNKIK